MYIRFNVITTVSVILLIVSSALNAAGLRFEETVPESATQAAGVIAVEIVPRAAEDTEQTAKKEQPDYSALYAKLRIQILTEKATDLLTIPLSRPYEVLGVKKDASKEEIDKAYRGLASFWRPDRIEYGIKLPEGRKVAEKVSEYIVRAYETMKTIAPKIIPATVKIGQEEYSLDNKHMILRNAYEKQQVVIYLKLDTFLYQILREEYERLKENDYWLKYMEQYPGHYFACAIRNKGSMSYTELMCNGLLEGIIDEVDFEKKFNELKQAFEKAKAAAAIKQSKEAIKH